MYPFPVSHFGGEPLIELSINADVNDYNIFTEAQNAGGSFDPADNVTNGLVRIILQNGIKVGSTSTATHAMTRGTGWGTGWDVDVVVEGTNTARVVGKGGLGGNGGRNLNIGPPVNISGGKGGGGGGGGGTQVGAGGTAISTAVAGSAGTATAGGAGGAGAAVPGSLITPTVGAVGGPAMEAPTLGEDIHLRPEAGALGRRRWRWRWRWFWF